MTTARDLIAQFCNEDLEGFKSIVEFTCAVISSPGNGDPLPIFLHGSFKIT
jgi:hypothetical protein